jgi:hypothetical protein
MMMRKTFSVAVAATVLVTVGSAGVAWAGPVLEYTGAISPLSAGDQSFGWSFTTNQAITVNALDALDPTGSGAAGTVRLYDGSGTVLASVKVTTSDPQEGSPISFYTQSISPVLLAANAIYYIVEDTSANVTTFDVRVTSLTTDPAITYDGLVAANGQGQNPTSANGYGSLNSGIFGPNFDIGPTAVPEPNSLALLGIGFAGLLGASLIRRHQAA